VKPSRVLAAIAVAAAFFGSLLLGDVKLSILVGVVAVAIAALGLDLLVAKTGELSLAHAALLGVGAFTTINAGDRGWPWPLAIGAGVVVTTAAATVAGLPSLRIRGLQVAITTLAFQVFAETFLFSRQDVTAAGRTLPRPGALQGDVELYLFALACLALVLLLRHRVGVTKAGRAFVAVRDIEPRASSYGVQPGSTKLLAYALSGAIVGLAGSVVALKAGSISAKDPFLLLESLLLVAIVVVGGAGSTAGIISAAVFVKALPQFASTIPFVDLRTDRVVPIASAVLLVVAVVAQPAGIGGLYRTLGRVVDRVLTPRRARARPEPTARYPELAATTRNAAELRRVPRGLRAQMPVRALLATTDVRVQYDGVHAIDCVSLEVRRGEIVGLIGANGAGKSTFFQAVSGLTHATGSIRYRGIELIGASPVGRNALGVARTFQDLGLVRAETVRDNVLLAQTWLARTPASVSLLALGTSVHEERELRNRADLALELFGLSHVAHVRLGDLPYGTMRTVEIASAVAAGPDLLLLDEATSGLGPEEAHELGDRMLALRDELDTTLLVIEHHVPVVARVCDYVYCLDSGSLIADGSPDQVIADPLVVESFLGRATSATTGEPG
jgi:ABC-type branched-subunit amino acid transport system ATPase component/ABC-type branched-subunit amino acid transport system permease subunit